MASPAASEDATYELLCRNDSKNDLDSLNLLQAEMTKTTRELEKLRMGLCPSKEKCGDSEKQGDASEESFVVPDLPRDRTKSALERISARQQEANVTELSVKKLEETNLTISVDAISLGHFSEKDSLTKKDIEHRDALDVERYETGSTLHRPHSHTFSDDRTVGRSLSSSRLQEGKTEMQMLNSPKSLPSVIEGDLSRASAWEQETATGRVLLQSLANENKLQEELELSKEEIRRLTVQLHQLKADYEKEAEKNRGTIHALLQRVDAISQQKQEELHLREQESQAKDEIIRKLQKTLQDAETAMKVMEKVLGDTKRCLDMERKQGSAKDQALIQIYEAVKPKLRDKDQENGDIDVRKDIVTKNPLLVAERLKGYVDGREKQVAELMKRIEEAEQKLKDQESEMEGAVHKLRTEHKEKLIQLNESHEKQLEALSERATNARKQTLGLQAQITAVEEHSHLEVKAKERQIAELSATIQSLKEKLEESAFENQTKLQKVQTQLQSTQSLLEERNAAKLQLEAEMVSVQRQLSEKEGTLKGTSQTLDEITAENARLFKEKEENLEKLLESKKLLHKKTEEITQLREKLREDGEKHERRLQQEVSRLETEARNKVTEREKENEIQMTALRENLGKVQTELEKRNSEIDLEKETTQAVVMEMKKLESQVEIISKEKAELASILDAKDKDLLVLQHERNLLENLYGKSRKEAQVELGKRDKLEGDLRELEPRYRELLVENQELLDKLEKEEKKVVEIVGDNTNLLNELARTNRELEKVKMSKNDLGKKLGVREKRLKQAEEDLMKEAKRLEVKTLETEKLQKVKETLEEELKMERVKLEQLTKGNASTMQQIFEQQAKNEKEKRILNSQIDILQNELRLVRGAMQANKAVDGKAVQFAEDMRKNAEMKRTLLESLESEKYHLEEQLEVAQQNVDKLERENRSLQASCSKAEKRLERLQKENGDMANHRREQKTLVVKLEAALEKAAFKFSESQRIIEKQEQDLARLKLQHQLELKELKGNLLNQFTTTHILPKIRNEFSDIPVNNITPSKKGASGAVNNDLKATSKVEKIDQDLERKHDVETELRRFLGEMYQMLRGKGAVRGEEKQQNDMEKDIPDRNVEKPPQWNNQSVTACELEGEPFSESSADHFAHSFLSSQSVTHNQEDKEENLTCSVSDDQSSSISVDRLSPVSTLLRQEGLPKRYVPQEMKGSKVNLDKARSQTEKGKVEKSLNQAMKRLNNGQEDRHETEEDTKTKVLKLQSKLERLAVMGNELKENNEDMERFLEIDGT